MKKIGYSLLIVGMLAALLGPFWKVDKEVDWKTMEAKIKELAKTDTYEKGTDVFIRKSYRLASGQYEHALVYKHVSAMEAEEIAVFYSKDTQQQALINKQVKQRKEAKYTAFAGYGERQSALIKQGEIFQKGDYIFLLVDKNEQQMRHAIEALFS